MLYINVHVHMHKYSHNLNEVMTQGDNASCKRHRQSNKNCSVKRGEPPI